MKMDEVGETRDQLFPGNHVIGSVDQVETDHTSVNPEQEHHDQQSNSSSSSSSSSGGDDGGSRVRRTFQRWQLRYMLQRFQQISVPSFASSDITSDTWSCTVVILTFWFFASIILILGFYGSYNLQLGPNSSYAIEANPLFAHSIKAQEADDQGEVPILYGFHRSPSLDVVATWSKSHIVSVEPSFHREWKYYLNAGSRVDIYYDVKHPGSDSLSLVISRGRETLVHWIDDPSYPNTTLSWNTIHGTGSITQDITVSETYYVAVGNLNLEAVEVYLNITIQSLLYNTSNADFKCFLSNRACSFKLALFRPNVAVLATPGATQVSADNDLFIQVSFGPQWLFYCTGSGIVTALILALFRSCDQYQTNITYDTRNQGRENVAQREPLLPSKSDDGSSMGSSYESASNEEDVLEDNIAEGSLTKDGGSNSNNNAGLCAICFDAPKDCFFVPCGHSAACFSCGSRIAEEAGVCPICRRKMKKVRKIFSV